MIIVIIRIVVACFVFFGLLSFAHFVHQPNVRSLTIETRKELLLAKEEIAKVHSAGILSKSEISERVHRLQERVANDRALLQSLTSALERTGDKSRIQFYRDAQAQVAALTAAQEFSSSLGRQNPELDGRRAGELSNSIEIVQDTEDALTRLLSAQNISRRVLIDWLTTYLITGSHEVSSFDPNTD